MGYYSEVAVEMTREDYKKLNQELSKQSFTTPQYYENFTSAEWQNYAKQFLERGYTAPEVIDFNKADTEYVRLYWNAIKWYGAPYIAFLEDFFLLNDVDFVRLGDSADDAEENWGLENYNIDVVRRLEFL